MAIEWRGKIDDPQWRTWADVGIAVGLVAARGPVGRRFAILVRGLPVDADKQMHLSFTDVLNPYTLLGGLATAGLFLFHGAVFLALKIVGRRARRRCRDCAGWLVAAGDGDRRRASACGRNSRTARTGPGLCSAWPWSRSWRPSALLRAGTRDGWAFVATTVVVGRGGRPAVRVLYPNLVPSTLNPDWSLTIYNASSTPYTLKIMTWVAVIFAPLVIAYQAWTYWVFRQRISADRIPEPIGLSRRVS